jgi:hypothetical protein
MRSLELFIDEVMPSFQKYRHHWYQSRSQRAQEIQKALLLLRAKAIEESDHSIGLRAGTRVILDCGQQSSIRWRGAPIMQEKDTLPNSPKRSSAELVRSGPTLRDRIGQP